MSGSGQYPMFGGPRAGGECGVMLAVHDQGLALVDRKPRRQIEDGERLEHPRDRF
jgi:hypothetical protein